MAPAQYFSNIRRPRGRLRMAGPGYERVDQGAFRTDRRPEGSLVRARPEMGPGARVDRGGISPELRDMGGPGGNVVEFTTKAGTRGYAATPSPIRYTDAQMGNMVRPEYGMAEATPAGNAMMRGLRPIFTAEQSAAQRLSPEQRRMQEIDSASMLARTGGNLAARGQMNLARAAGQDQEAARTSAAEFDTAMAAQRGRDAAEAAAGLYRSQRDADLAYRKSLQDAGLQTPEDAAVAAGEARRPPTVLTTEFDAKSGKPTKVQDIYRPEQSAPKQPEAFADDPEVMGIDRQLADLEQRYAGGERNTGFLNMNVGGLNRKIVNLQKKRQERIAELQKTSGASPADNATTARRIVDIVEKQFPNAKPEDIEKQLSPEDLSKYRRARQYLDNKG